MYAIEAAHVFKVFGKRPDAAVDRLKKGATPEELRAERSVAAVIDASFNVKEGEVFVVMGLSGSGKSTLIRMVNGLVEPTAGELRIYGEDIVGMKPQQLRRTRRDKVSMVFQHFALFPHRTVGENAAYGLSVQGTAKDEAERKAKEALKLVGLKGWEDSYPGQLSGGMRQRVGLARALATGTDIMLMDESFSALDPLIKREMQDQLIELQRKLGKTILFITHDLNEAMRLGDRIAMMRDGRIVQVGTGEQILNHPANDYVTKFVQDVDRARVLTAGAIMTPAPSNQVTTALEPEQLVRVSRHAHLAELLQVSADNEHALTVVDDDGTVVGSLARDTLLRSLGHSPTKDPEQNQGTALPGHSEGSEGDTSTQHPARMEVSRP